MTFLSNVEKDTSMVHAKQEHFRRNSKRDANRHSYNLYSC